jgi:hypothetical protein
MSTTRIKEKLSKIVKGQLPSFIQEDYETFVSFIEAYYSFLEQDQGAYELIQNLSSYNDLDETIPSFLEYFLKTYAPQIPSNVVVDQKLLVKKIKYLYESKGSEASFELLFKILFDTDVTVEYPNNFTLIPSDGRWSQKVSIQLRTVFGDRTKIIDRFLKYNFQGINYNVPIIDVKFLSESISEVFLDPVYLPPDFIIGDTVEIRSANAGGILLFVGQLEPVTNSYTITSPGLNFFPGQTYTIAFNQGFGTVVQVTSINETTGIQTLKFVRFGQGYDIQTGTVFTLELDPTKNIQGAFASSVNLTTQGFGSKGVVQYLFTDPVNSYFLEDYTLSDYNAASTETLFDNSTFNEQKDTFGLSPEIALVTFRFGTISRYPGEFTTSNGFISEPVVNLQDSKRFQPFAYQTNTEQDIEEFFDIVKETIHPAGQVLFNNKIISQNIDLSGNISVEVIQNVFFEVISTFAVSDEVSLTIIIPQNSGNIVLVDDTPTLNIFANKFEDIEIIENIEKDISLLKDSDIVILDQIGVLQNQFSDAFGEFDSIEELDVFKLADPAEIQPTEFAVITPTLFKEDEFNLTSEIDNVTILTNFEDLQEVQDELEIIDVYLNKQDVVQPSENTLISYSTEFNNDVSTNSEPNLSVVVSFTDLIGFDDTTTIGYIYSREFDSTQNVFEEFQLSSNLEYTNNTALFDESNLIINNFVEDQFLQNTTTSLDIEFIIANSFSLNDPKQIELQTEFVNSFSNSDTSNVNVGLSIFDNTFDLASSIDNIIVEKIISDNQAVDTITELNYQTIFITNLNTQNVNVEKQIETNFVDLFAVVENSNNSIQINIQTPVEFNSETIFEIETAVFDAEIILEQSSIQYQTTINNSLSTPSDNTSGFLSDYAEDFFSEFYVGELIFNV